MSHKPQTPHQRLMDDTRFANTKRTQSSPTERGPSLGLPQIRTLDGNEKAVGQDCRGMRDRQSGNGSLRRLQGGHVALMKMAVFRRTVLQKLVKGDKTLSVTRGNKRQASLWHEKLQRRGGGARLGTRVRHSEQGRHANSADGADS